MLNLYPDDKAIELMLIFELLNVEALSINAGFEPTTVNVDTFFTELKSQDPQDKIIPNMLITPYFMKPVYVAVMQMEKFIKHRVDEVDVTPMTSP